MWDDWTRFHIADWLKSQSWPLLAVTNAKIEPSFLKNEAAEEVRPLTKAEVRKKNKIDMRMSLFAIPHER